MDPTGSTSGIHTTKYNAIGCAERKGYPWKLETTSRFDRTLLMDIVGIPNPGTGSRRVREPT